MSIPGFEINTRLVATACSDPALCASGCITSHTTGHCGLATTDRNERWPKDANGGSTLAATSLPIHGPQYSDPTERRLYSMHTGIRSNYTHVRLPESINPAFRQSQQVDTGSQQA